MKPASIIAKCDQRNGKYLALTLMYRDDLIPSEVGHAIGSFKTKRFIKFVEYIPTGLKCVMNFSHQQPFQEVTSLNS